jgi:hypothetical protein
VFVAILGVAGGLLCLLSVGMMAIVISEWLAGRQMAGQPQGPDSLIGGAFVALLGPGLLFASLWLGYSRLRCHERGVWRGTLFGQRSLRYSDVGSFQYSAVRHYHNGAYVGTHVSLKFRPLTPGQGRPLHYSTTTKGDDEGLDNLRDHISRAIAGRMAEQFQSGQPVIWTSNLQIVPEGILYRPAGLFGRKEMQLLPFASYRGHDLKQGVFYLYGPGNKQVATEQSSVDNFYPGFFLLLLLMHQPAEAEVAEVANPGESSGTASGG